MSRRLLLAVAVGTFALLAVGSLATASSSKARTSKDTIIQFRMPSNNIFCAFISSTSPKSKYLRCDIMSGIKPKPSSKGCVEGSRGISVDMNVTGKATYPCSSDTVYNKSAPKLAYGKTWHHSGFTCKSTENGLTCTNASGHGFFLSRQRTSRF
ncbi:MAG: DUF6636 domain-containing protein [Gaiellaceae bacterium]|jgi:hypothetical protein